MKQSYLVMWEVEVDADNADQAATIARVMQLDPQSLATEFNVIARCSDCGGYHNNSKIETVDLMEGSRDH